MKKINLLLVIYFTIFLIAGLLFSYKCNYNNNLRDITTRKVRDSNNLWDNLYNQLSKIEDKDNLTETFNLLKKLNSKIEKLNNKDISDREKAITLKNLLQDKFEPIRNSLELKEMLSSGKASCLGLSKIYYLFGNAMGLNVKMATTFPSHFVNLVKLDTGNIIIDLQNKYKSYVFKWNKAYEKKGETWFQTKNLPLPLKYDNIQIIQEDEMKFINYWIKGTKFFTKDEMKKTQKSYLKASKLAPNLSINYYNLGSITAKLAKRKKSSGNTKESNKLFRKAIQYYNKAINLNPKESHAIFYRGSAKLNLGATEEALKDYKKAINLNSSLKDLLPPYIKNKILKE